MKKTVAILLAFLLLLSGCGQESVSQEETVTESAEATTAAATGVQYYTEEITEADGTKITRRRLNDENGIVVWSRTTRPDGSFVNETFDEEGNPIEKTSLDRSGATCRQYYYSGGTLQKEITQFPGGAYTELHYREDGTMTYEKHLEYDSQGVETVTETKWEEDGSRGFFITMSNGMTSEAYFNAEDILLKSCGYDPETKIYASSEYFEDGSVKMYTLENRETNEYTYRENYGNGAPKRICNIDAAGLKHDQTYDEEGYTTYIYKDSLLGVTEAVTDETGKLTKFVMEGTVYEGQSIPYWVYTTFNFRK